MARKLGWIRQFHLPAEPGTVPLLVFPHAGAGASAYRDFSKVLSEKFDVIVFQYPGRQDRAAEPPLGSLAEIAAGAFQEFAGSEYDRGVPIVTFGHSMGAVVAFEFVRVAESAGIRVRRLNVAATVAPHLAASKPPHPTDDATLLHHLAALDGTAVDVIANDDLMKRSLPVLRADFTAFDAYTCPEDVKVAASIQALGGDRDPLVSLADLYGWHKHSDDVKVTVFDGGHFFIDQHLDAVSELLSDGAAS